MLHAAAQDRNLNTAIDVLRIERFGIARQAGRLVQSPLLHQVEWRLLAALPTEWIGDL